MKLHPDSDAIQRSGCAILVNLQSCPHSLDADLMGRSAAVAAMTKHPTDVRIQFLGGKVLIATPSDELSHVTLFGGPGALARAMRVCGTNHDFQIAACRQLGAFYACQVAARYGDRDKLGAFHKWSVQRQGLGTSAAFSALIAARQLYSKSTQSLGNLAESVVKQRPGMGKTLPQVDPDLPNDVVTEKGDWAEALASIMGALEAFPGSARVQEAGLSELRKWAFSGGPAQQTYSESKPGAKPPVPNGYMKRADYTWAFGGVPQFPYSPFFVDPSSGLEYSVELPKNQLLLSRALMAAASAVKAFLFDSKCIDAAPLAVAELLNMASSEFDIVGFAQTLGKLRRVALGEDLGGEHGLAIRTTFYKAGANSGSDPAADRALTLRPVSSHFDLHEEALCIVLERMALAFGLVMDAFQEVVISTEPRELNATILSNLSEYAKFLGAFCSAYRMPGIIICRQNYKRLEDANVPSVGDGDKGQSEEISTEGGTLSGSRLGVPADGEVDTKEPEKVVSRLPTVPEILAGPAKRAGLVPVLEATLWTFTLLLPWIDASREAALELAQGLESLYNVYSDLHADGGGEQSRDPHARETKPYGADWKASGLKALVVSLLAHDKAFVLACRAGPEFESLDFIMRSFARALHAAIAIPAIRAGGAAGLCQEPPILAELVAVLHRYFLRPDCGRRENSKGGRLAFPLPHYEEELHKAVSELFIECPEVSVYVARVGAPLLLETFLQTWGRNDPVRSDAPTITLREKLHTQNELSYSSFLLTNHPNYHVQIGTEALSCDLSFQF
jgi:hypothetical protein